MPALTGFLALGSIADGEFEFSELPASGGYARQQIDLSMIRPGHVVNTIAVVFPVITTVEWTPYNALAIFDAVEGGNQLMAWKIGSQYGDLRQGRRVRIKARAIGISFPVAVSNQGTEVILSGPYALSAQQLFLTPVIRMLAQEDYEALPAKDDDTLYFTTEE